MPLSLTRSIMVILLPGFIVCLPIIIAAIDFSEVRTITRETPQVSIAIAFTATVLMGSILEALSSRIEISLDKKWEQELSVRANWFDYLAHNDGNEPVGFRYLSRLATTMYFELSMACATILSGILSIIFISLNYGLQSCGIIAFLAVIFFLMSYTLYKSGCDTHFVLCTARKEIMSRLKPKRE